MVRRRSLAAAALLAGIIGSATLVSPSAHAVGVYDLAVSQTVLGTPTVGGTATFQFRVTNNGPDATTSEVIMPGGVTGGALSAVSPVGGVCAKGRNSVYTCNFGVMAAGASATALVTIKVDNTATSVSSRVSVSGLDADPTNNVSTLSAPVAAAPGDLQMNATASTRSPDAGAQFDYRFQIKNTGKSASLTPSFDATLPANVNYVSVGSLTSPTCTVTDLNVHCDLATIAAGGQDTIVLSVDAPPTAGESATVTASAVGANGDANLSNNSGSVTITSR